MSDLASEDTGYGYGEACSTSTSLLERVKAYEQDAWRHFVHLYGPVVYGWCRRAGLATHDAADVSQEVLASVAAHLGSFRRDRPGDSFRGWLWTICRNKILDHFRSQGRRPKIQGGTTAQRRLAQLPEVVEQLPASGDSMESDTSGVIRRALELLRPSFEERTWQAFWRMAVEGQAAAEIADDLGMTKKAVRQAKFRVLRRLREELKGLID